MAGATETATGSAPSAVPAAQPAPDVPAAVETKKAEPAIRIGYVDLARIGKDSARGKAAQALIKGKVDKFQAKLAARQKQLEKQKAALEAKMATLSPEERAAKAKGFEKKVEEYRKIVQNAEKELQPLQEELLGSLYKEIEQAATDYGKANGYAAIVRQKELLYLGSGVEAQDVTEAVMKLVDEKGQKQ